MCPVARQCIQYLVVENERASERTREREREREKRGRGKEGGRGG